jgi:hypothetical protein
MKWITRERAKIDRIACPWLIKRFVDRDAEFIYVPFEKVVEKAKELDATPFDIPNVEYTHYGDECTFDYIVKKHKIKDDAIRTLSVIVRGADTDRHDIASQASGLWAISAGLAYDIKDDHELLQKGMMIYDSLYTWAKHLQNEKHTQNPFENTLLDVYKKFLVEKKQKKNVPEWAKELKEIIQDQIDTNLTLSLKEISERDGAGRMQKLIVDLLAFSRVSTRGKDPEAVDCGTALGHSLANLELAIKESGAVITHGPLPTVLVDPTQLSLLLQNLVSNAIKFRGDRPPPIHMSARPQDSEWEVSVRDDGIGFDPQFSERIFVIFQRLHGKAEYPGTGIGLSICKKIVQRHGGRIWVESAAGQGSTFYFTLPAATPANAGTPQVKVQTASA